MPWLIGEPRVAVGPHDDAAAVTLPRLGAVVQSLAGIGIVGAELPGYVGHDRLRHLTQVGHEGAQVARRAKLKGVAETIV